MYDDVVNAAVARMDADIEVIFELFGADAEDPASLLARLPREACAERAGGRLTTWGVGMGWTARAARLLRDATAASERTLRQCAQQGFDDPDARVRGVAWCALAKLQDNEATEDTVKTIIAEEFKRRVTGAADAAENDGDALAFALMVGAQVTIVSGRHLIKAIEREYIESHSGGDADLISASPSAALGFLDHPESGRRLAALTVASHADVRDEAVSYAVRRLMTSDPDPEVRSVAIEAYATIFQGSSDPECLRRLAEIVLDEGQRRRNRFAAYAGLFVVSDRLGEFPLRCTDAEKLARLRDRLDDADWPIPMQWEFVKQCAGK